MSDDAKVYIAGRKTAADWTAFRETLAKCSEIEPWRRAIRQNWY
jgi:hypothetical protein